MSLTSGQAEAGYERVPELWKFRDDIPTGKSGSSLWVSREEKQMDNQHHLWKNSVQLCMLHLVLVVIQTLKTSPTLSLKVLDIYMTLHVNIVPASDPMMSSGLCAVGKLQLRQVFVTFSWNPLREGTAILLHGPWSPAEPMGLLPWSISTQKCHSIGVI